MGEGGRRRGLRERRKEGGGVKRLCSEVAGRGLRSGSLADAADVL